MTRRLPLRHAGFSLLEAIVAMTIMATSLLALYAWLSTSTLGLNRARDSALALQDARSALALIEAVNPMAEPTGVRTLAPLEVRWTSTPLTELRHGISRSGTATQFDLRLYELDVEVRRDGNVVREFSVRKAGWVAARSIANDDF